jgi:hypothetical protein
MLSTPDEVRRFLRMCLDSGPVQAKRPTTQLTVVMPDWLLGHIAEHAPHLAAMHADVSAAEELVARARVSYAQALLAWIAEPPAVGAVAPFDCPEHPQSEGD